MEHLTSPELMTFVLVLVGIAAVVTALDKGLDAWRHLSGEKDRQERDAKIDAAITALENRMAKAEERLGAGDKRFNAIETDLTQILTIMNAELMHTITGNSVEALKSVKTQLDEYMARR